MEGVKKEKISPFAWVDCLTQKTGDMMAEYGEAEYNKASFMINRAMSQYQDCILYAAEINLYRDLDGLYCYDFYMNAIRKKKRFAKWGKKKTGDGDILAVMEHYGYSRTKAEEALRVLTPEQVKYIVEFEKAKNEQV